MFSVDAVQPQCSSGTGLSHAARGQVRSMPRNSVFIHEGERGDSLFVILSGRAKVFVADADGREMVLDIHGPGAYVGEMALDGHPRAASVMAMEPTVCSVLTRDALRAAIVANPDLAIWLCCRLPCWVPRSTGS